MCMLHDSHSLSFAEPLRLYSDQLTIPDLIFPSLWSSRYLMDSSVMNLSTCMTDQLRGFCQDILRKKQCLSFLSEIIDGCPLLLIFIKQPIYACIWVNTRINSI